MYNFTTETQGLDTFLVQEIVEDTKLDTAGIGMLLNNKISGICPVSSIEIDNKKMIRYQISSQIPLQQFFLDEVDKKRFLTVLYNILTAIENMEDFMLDPGMLLLDRQYIYINVGTLQTDLIYYPVLEDKKEFRLETFVKKMIMDTEFNPQEQDNYVTMLISYLNHTEQLNITGLKQYITTLLKTTNLKPQMTMPQTAAPYTGAPYQTAQQPYQGQMMQGVMQDSAYQPYQGQPMQAAAQPQPQAQPMQAMPQSQPQAQPMTGAAYNPAGIQIPTGGTVQPQPEKKKGLLSMLGINAKPKDEKPKKEKAKKEKPEKRDKKHGKQDVVTPTGIVIPNMDNMKNSTLPQPPRPAGAPILPPQPQQPAMNMTPPQPQQPAMNMTPPQPQQPAMNMTPPQPQQPVMNMTPPQPQQPVMNMTPPQPMTPPSYAAPANFGETVVLGADNAGETTVLNAGYNTVQKQKNPYLIRKKNNERIEINKNIFRIGKERSYADYCIADNSAVSRSHADIIAKENEFYIVDNNSLNHTFLNGKQIPSSQMQKLTDYMMIQLADEIFEFRL